MVPHRLSALAPLFVCALLAGCSSKADSGDGAAGAAGAGGEAAGSSGAGGSSAGAGGSTAGSAGSQAGSAGAAGLGGAGAAGDGGAGGGGAGGALGAVGAACKAKGDCASGFCADGVCCQTACDAPCESCALPSSKGTCGTAPKDKVCRPSATGCDAPDTCDGTATTCPADLVVTQGGDGVLECKGYLCDGAAKTCTGTCATTKDCATGYTCISKACVAYKRFFISSDLHDGNLGGLTGADKICQDLATAAKLPGTYKAWLADSKETPLTRFTQFAGPYALVSGVKVANDWKDLTDGSFDSGIFRDEKGGQVSMVLGWTGLLASSFAPQETCKDWTSNEPADDGRALYSTWNQNVVTPCNSLEHLYCVEQ